MTNKEILKQLEKMKIVYNQKLAKNGTYITFNLFFNKELRNLIKKSVINEKIGYDINLGYDESEGERKYKTINRYKVKTIIYRNLHTSYKDLIFSCDLLDNGKLTLKVNELENIYCMKKDIKNTIDEITKNILNSEIKQEITFKLNLNNSDGENE